MVVCARFSKNRDETEEIMQDGFYRIFKYMHQYKFAGSFEMWMKKIMVNTAIQRYKAKSKLYAIIPIQLEHFQLSDQSNEFSGLEVKQMIELIQHLPPSCRMVFNLYVFEGYKHREIAEILNISEGTSKSNLFDARQLLQKALLRENSYLLKMIK